MNKPKTVNERLDSIEAKLDEMNPNSEKKLADALRNQEINKRIEELKLKGNELFRYSLGEKSFKKDKLLIAIFYGAIVFALIYGLVLAGKSYSSIFVIFYFELLMLLNKSYIFISLMLFKKDIKPIRMRVLNIMAIDKSHNLSAPSGDKATMTILNNGLNYFLWIFFTTGVIVTLGENYTLVNITALIFLIGILGEFFFNRYCFRFLENYLNLYFYDDHGYVDYSIPLRQYIDFKDNL